MTAQPGLLQPARGQQNSVMTDLDDRRPIYQRLSDQLALEIAQNKLRPGEVIPTEPELAAKHKVALGTVRKAIDVLVGEGLIVRVQGRGMFVRRPDFGTAFVRFIRFFGSAGDRRMPKSRILSREALVGPREVTDALRLDGGTRVIRLRRLRIHDGLPVLFEEIWLEEARFAPVLTMEETQPQLLYPLYESLCGEIVARAEETITIETANDDDAELLSLVVGRPVVLIDRLAFGYDGRPIEWRRSRGPASDFRYKIEIR
jgi:GntR family transcriptional regulator